MLPGQVAPLRFPQAGVPRAPCSGVVVNYFNLQEAGGPWEGTPASSIPLCWL